MPMAPSFQAQSRQLELAVTLSQTTGIPATDLDTATQSIISSVASKYVKPAGGIPKSDLASAVQTSLTAADNAPTSLAAQSDVNVNGVSNNQVLTYNTGSSKWIPSTVSSTTVSDATSGSKGIIQLAGDLGGSGGSAAAPLITAGAVTGAKIANSTITDANISSSAAIAKSKLGLSWYCRC